MTCPILASLLVRLVVLLPAQRLRLSLATPARWTPWALSVFLSSRRRHTMFDCDWSSDVCSSDLRGSDRRAAGAPAVGALRREQRVAGLRRHRAHPLPRRRAPGRTALRHRPRRHHPYPDHQRRRPTGSSRPRHPPAPARTLALAERLEQPIRSRLRRAYLTCPHRTVRSGHPGHSLARPTQHAPPEQAGSRDRQVPPPPPPPQKHQVIPGPTPTIHPLIAAQASVKHR